MAWPAPRAGEDGGATVGPTTGGAGRSRRTVRRFQAGCLWGAPVSGGLAHAPSTARRRGPRGMHLPSCGASGVPTSTRGPAGHRRWPRGAEPGRRVARPCGPTATASPPRGCPRRRGVSCRAGWHAPPGGWPPSWWSAVVAWRPRPPRRDPSPAPGRWPPVPGCVVCPHARCVPGRGAARAARDRGRAPCPSHAACGHTVAVPRGPPPRREPCLGGSEAAAGLGVARPMSSRHACGPGHAVAQAPRRSCPRAWGVPRPPCLVTQARRREGGSGGEGWPDGTSGDNAVDLSPHLVGRYPLLASGNAH